MTTSLHHRRSIRLPQYDYSQAGYYFITICTYNREQMFGKIITDKNNNPEMILKDEGKIAYDEWIKTGEMRPNIELDEFVIMPNHIHGIIKINNQYDDTVQRNTMMESCSRGTMHRAPTTCNDATLTHCAFMYDNDGMNHNGDIIVPERMGTRHRAPTAPTAPTTQTASATKPQYEQFSKPTSNSIPTIIRGYKSTVTNQINKLRNMPGFPVWQRNYYEHVIRDDKSYFKIAEYIKTNLQHWQNDKYYE